MVERESAMVRIKPSIRTDLEQMQSTCAWKCRFESSCTPGPLVVRLRFKEESRIS
jgi:hypothetical protein